MNTERLSDLDRIRIRDGDDACRKALADAARKSRRNAAALLNAQTFTFPCFYVLLPQITSLRLAPLLNRRDTVALAVVRRISEPAPARKDSLLWENPMAHPVLFWMVKTGSAEDGLDEDYEQIMEICISVLVHTYREKRVLPYAVGMIFERAQKGHNIHDLIWSVFRMRDPEILKLIAEHICSENREESELACRLLHMEPSGGDRQKKYEDFLSELEENSPFLSFTGESLQYSSEPVVCKVDRERKYLVRENGASAEPAGETEGKCLECFRSLCEEDRKCLSDYSCRLHQKDAAVWKEWIKSPMEHQIETAKTKREGSK